MITYVMHVSFSLWLLVWVMLFDKNIINLKHSCSSFSVSVLQNVNLFKFIVWTFCRSCRFHFMRNISQKESVSIYTLFVHHCNWIISYLSLQTWIRVLLFIRDCRSAWDSKEYVMHCRSISQTQSCSIAHNKEWACVKHIISMSASFERKGDKRGHLWVFRRTWFHPAFVG